MTDHPATLVAATHAGPRPDTDPEAGPVLLRLARTAIASRGGPFRRDAGGPPWLEEPGATFVTLTRSGRLRGCQGSVDAHRSLRDDVRRNACAAAFHDPRFPPLCAGEVASTRIEVSLLSATEHVPCSSRRELLARLRPGVDGVVVAWHGHRGTFLPQAWEQLPDPEDFLDHLLHKAGLPVCFWEPDLSVRRYTVTSWTEAAEAPAEDGRIPE